MARFRPFIMTWKLKPLFVASGPVGSSRKHADLETAQRVEQSSSQISPCKSLAYMFLESQFCTGIWLQKNPSNLMTYKYHKGQEAGIS